MGVNDVEAAVVEGKSFGVGLLKFDVVDTPFGARGPSLLEDVGGGVDGDDTTR
jgi:hypothetical protein